jgi:hypothetical protein
MRDENGRATTAVDQMQSFLEADPLCRLLELRIEYLEV